MPRGYRFLLLAAFGLAIAIAFGLGSYITALNYPQEERYQPYRYAAAKPEAVETAAAGPASTQALQYRTPCNKPEGQGESDLCAQWRAANAAEDSATWTKWGFWIGVIGSSLLLWQIILTREAVQDTSEATDAMREANRLAEDAQRPWLEVDVKFHFITKSGDGFILSVTVLIKNIGHLPAYHATISHALAPAIRNPIHDFQLLAEFPREEGQGYKSDLIVLPAGSAQDQELIYLERGDPRHPWDEGVAPEFMITVHYNLPNGRGAQSSAWFAVAKPTDHERHRMIRWDWEPDDTELVVESYGYIRVT